MTRRRALVPVAFDCPTAILELLFGRAALALPTMPAMPQVLQPPQARPAPEGAAARWATQFDETMRQLEGPPESPGAPRWLATGDARAVDVSRARDWVHEQRATIIDRALVASPANVPRLQRRTASLQGAGIDRVCVLPLNGRYAALYRPATLLVSLATFLDDMEWGSAIESLVVRP